MYDFAATICFIGSVCCYSAISKSNRDHASQPLRELKPAPQLARYPCQDLWSDRQQPDQVVVLPYTSSNASQYGSRLSARMQMTVAQDWGACWELRMLGNATHFLSIQPGGPTV